MRALQYHLLSHANIPSTGQKARAFPVDSKEDAYMHLALQISCLGFKERIKT